MSLFLSFKYDFNSFDNLLLAITLVTSFISFKEMKSLRENVFLLLIVVYIFCSVHVVALFELTSFGFYKNTIALSEYARLAQWGNHLFFLYFFILFFLSFIKGRNKNKYTIVGEYKKKDFTSFYIISSVLVLILQGLSLVFGLAGNQEDARIILPLHLNGIIDEYRASIFPFIFVIYLYDRFSSKKRVDRFAVDIYILYAVLEIFVRNSKGSLIFSFLPVFLICILMVQHMSKRLIIKYVVPFALAVFLLYPIIENARLSGQITINSVMDSAKSIDKADESEQSSLYIRTFLMGIYYTKCDDYVDKNETYFDFKNVPMLLVLRGGSAYMTRIIDGIPDTVHHSSGITGLCDALLWGGYPMCYIVLVVLLLLAFWADKGRFFNRNILYKTIFFLWFYPRLIGTTISFFIDNLFLPTVVSIILEIIIVKYYIRNYCKQTSPYGRKQENLHLSYANNE